MKRITFSIILIMALSIGTSQAPPDSLQIIIEKIVEKEVDSQMSWIKWILGFSVSGLSILGIYLWFWQIKKSVEKAIKEKVDTIIEEKMADKIGVKFEVLKSYFQEIQHTQALKQKRILVINKTAGKWIDLEKAILKAGFQLPLFQKWEQILPGIDTNLYDLILIDNHDGEISEKDIVQLYEKYNSSLRIVCFTSKDVSNETFQLVSGKVRFAKDINYIGIAIENALK